MKPLVSKSELLGDLPPIWPEELWTRLREGVAESRRKVVVLDDDPTGTQTVYGVPVLTTWKPEQLAREFAHDLPGYYLLTNTRAFPAAEAVRINQEIARNLTAAAMRSPGRSDFVLVSRSDSTLRGHFPAETDALGQTLTGSASKTPPVLLVPYFEAGGRYTVNDVHYVAEGDHLVPAAETPFAKDAAFGYRHSNLREWVEEKTGGKVKSAEVLSISLDDLRLGGPMVVQRKLRSLCGGQVCIANSAAPRDQEVLAWAALQAENAGIRLIYRTAASFVAARLGLAPRALWKPPAGRVAAPATTEGEWPEAGAGLIVVGSHVRQTTTQLERLLQEGSFEPVEVSVAALLAPGQREDELTRVVRQTNTVLRAGRDVVVFTSRRLVAGAHAEASLAIGKEVSEALVQLLRRVEIRPRYLIAKGGITSSDLATRGLGVKRAMVLGQILPGVPIWELGAETRYPGLPYVVFPGNVGGPEALLQAVAEFSSATRHTK